MLIETSVGMILDSTRETMRVTRNPSDHNANFGRDAHTNYLLACNPECFTIIKTMSLCSSYGNYFYHDLVDSFMELANYTKGE